MQSWIHVRVARRHQETPEICALDLIALPGAPPLPRFTAGSHIDVRINATLVRQYSLCGDPLQTESYQIAVLREKASRGGSSFMHDQVVVGQDIEIGAPRNHFPLASVPRPSLLLGGGVGITPLLSMAARLTALGQPFDLHYWARSRANAAFCEQLANSAFSSSVHFHFDDATPTGRFDLPALLSAAPGDAYLYTCGPGGFVDWVLSSGRDAGWADARMNREYFTVAAAAPAATESFDIKLANTGMILTIPPDKSIVDVLTDNGIPVAATCNEGLCGTCLTRVLDGVPEHHDHYLSETERARNDQCLICCCRSQSSLLVLDL